MAFVQIIDVIRWLFHRGPALRIEYRLCTTFNADMNYITIVYCGVSIYGYMYILILSYQVDVICPPL